MPQRCQIGFLNLAESLPGGIGRTDGVAFLPAAGGVLEKILARLAGEVQVLEIESGIGGWLSRCAATLRRGAAQRDESAGKSAEAQYGESR